LPKDSAGILLGESNSAELRKEKNRDEKGFKISAGFAGISDNILSTFGIILSVLFIEKDSNSTILFSSSLRIFWFSRLFKSRTRLRIARRYLLRRMALV
jgi:hypothetical protein